MKELSIQEKAHLYDEAIERANELLYVSDKESLQYKTIKHILPYLTESDERIRKALIRFHKSTIDIDGIKGEEIIDWLEKKGKNNMGISESTKQKLEDNLNKALEKETPESWNKFLDEQGEQKSFARYKVGDTIYYNSFGEVKSMIVANITTDSTNNPMYEDENGNAVFQNDIVEQKPTDNVEPKFKVGDWVVNKFGDVWHIDSFDKKNYQVSNGDKYNYFLISKQNEMHLWTIQDAKDGDVLCTYECDEPKIVFILKGTPKKHYALSYHCYYNIMYPHFGSDSEKGCLAPNDEDVKPANKEQRDLLFQKMKEEGYECDADKKELKIKKIEPKTTAWTPMDEQHVENLLAIIEGHGYPGEVAWLNSLKDRVQSKQEWSEDDIKMFVNIKACLRNANKDYSREVDWLISLKPQSKQQWSEEDESHIRYLIECLEHCKKGVSLTMTASTAQEYINWLKSLRPQSQWKPSDAQMKALKEACDEH